MNNTRLSHSQLSRYQSCAKDYDYYYNHRIRPVYQKAYFAFGAAFDKGAEILVKSRDLEMAKLAFIEKWKYQDINGEKTDLEYYDGLEYGKYDLDMDLVDDNTDKASDNTLCWRSLKTKGMLMLEALQRDILPRIGQVFSTQEEIKLENNDGDKVIGFSDIVAEFDGIPTVLDIKTSAVPYDIDAVKVSQQLALYVHDLQEKYNTRNAGFIVIQKKVNKEKTKVCQKCGANGSDTSHKTCNSVVDGGRCHGTFTITKKFSMPTQVLVEEVPLITEEIVLENVDIINKAIKSNIYPRNLNNCKGKYGTCTYYNLCYSNDMTNLSVVEKKEEIKQDVVKT